jgi:hypothetical protein
MNFIWNNPKEIATARCSIGLHQSPMPPWHPGLKTSCTAQAGGLWPAHASQCTASARPERAQCAASAHRCTITVAGWQTWHGSQWCGEGLPAMRSSAHSPSWFLLQAATRGPRRGGRNRGPHRRGRRGGGNRRCRWRKWLPSRWRCS